MNVRTPQKLTSSQKVSVVFVRDQSVILKTIMNRYQCTIYSACLLQYFLHLMNCLLGDNNFGDDRLLYAHGLPWLQQHHIMGRAVG
jgi:hypothetical protein